MAVLTLRIRTGETYLDLDECLSLTLEREIYTPYDALTAVFLAQADADYSAASQIELYFGTVCIFLGIADNVTKMQRGGVTLLSVKSRTFTSLLTQNELEPGLHSNLTLQTLVSGFYTLPHITAEANTQSGYVYVRERTSLWDSVASFVYKISGRYPYVRGNEVRFSLEAQPVVHVPSSAQVVETGITTDTTRLISHYHMADIDGNPNAYEAENAAARYAQIVRHKQIPFDRQFLSNPQSALTYRNLFSCRGDRARYVTYAGFANEQSGECVSYGQHLQAQTICRVRLTYSTQGLRTTLWAYEDGYYNHA